DLPAWAERDHAERRERRERGENRRADVEHVDRGGREEALLTDQLHQVGDRLQQAERADAVRAVAELHAREHLALDPGHVGEREHHEVDDQGRLDQRDPPGLCHLETSTRPPRSLACCWAIRTTPARRSRAIRARSSSDVPLWETVTVSPVAIFLSLASSGDSSTSASGRWKSSSGTRSTAGPEKSGR